MDNQKLIGRPVSNYFLHEGLFRQDRHYEKKTIKVLLTGSRATFFIQSATTSIKVWDVFRLHPDTLKEIIAKFNSLKQ